MSRIRGAMGVAVAVVVVAGGWAGAAASLPEACKPVKACGPVEKAPPACGPAKVHRERVKVVRRVKVRERVEVCKRVKVHKRVEVCKPVKKLERVEVCKPVKTCGPVETCGAVDAHHAKLAVARERVGRLLATPKHLAAEHRERQAYETVYVAPVAAGSSSETSPSPTTAPRPASELPPAPSPSRG